MHRFVAMVEAGYNECIYHNGLHAADVTHALHCLLDCEVMTSRILICWFGIFTFLHVESGHVA